jgi:hypothetical protein
MSVQEKCTGPDGIRLASAFQPSTSFSCNEFHWSSPGCVSCSQYHWMIELSTRLVGVSALYSSSFAGPVPS